MVAWALMSGADEIEMADTLSLFQSIGLSEAKAKDTVKNVIVSNSLKSLITEVKKAS